MFLQHDGDKVEQQASDSVQTDVQDRQADLVNCNSTSSGSHTPARLL
jgi:hypothetical protein